MRSETRYKVRSIFKEFLNLSKTDRTFVLRILVYRILKQVLISYRKFINNLISEV